MLHDNTFSYLKPGDPILIKASNFASYKITESKVDKVTPTGLIKVGSRYFYQDGTERTSSTFCRARLYHYEPDLVESVKRQTFCTKVVRRLRNITEDQITYEQAVAINKILGKNPLTNN